MAEAATAGEGPKLVEVPTGDVFERFYPERARRLEVSGSATIACTSTNAGLLTNCRITHEWPQGFNFGDAALRVTPFFRLSGPGAYKAKIRFNLADDSKSYAVRLNNGGSLGLVSRPTEKQLTAAYPGNGAAVVSANLLCKVRPEGRLTDCMGPPDQPLEATEAAKRMAALYRTKTPPKNAVVAVYMMFVPPDPDDGAGRAKEPDGL